MAKIRARKKQVIGVTVSVAAVVIAVTPIVGTAATKQFIDIHKESFYYDAIQNLAERKIVGGYPDGLFKPEQEVTRAEAAQMIVRVLNLDLKNSKTPFIDVKAHDWHAKGIYTLYDAKLISGVSKTSFAPNKAVSRAEFAQMLVNAYHINTAQSTMPFTDMKENAWYGSAVNILYTAGLIKGKTTDIFAPNEGIKRGDVAWLLAQTDAKFAKLPVKEPVKENFKLSIMHTNDTHGHLDEVAKRATAVQEVRKEKPNALLLDAGDVFSGTLYFNEFQGAADIEFMNYLKYDAMVFGNHEFDLGSTPDGHKKLAEFVRKADFPIVSSNMNYSKDPHMSGLFNDAYMENSNNGEVYKGIIKEVDGEKIGIFGLTTEETAAISSPNDIEFENYIAAAEKAVASFQSKGVDKIIAITHIGFDDNPAIDNDLLLGQVDGIDVIVGGHSHTKLEQPVIITKDKNDVKKDPTVIVQAYQYGEFLGTLDVDFDEKGVVVGHTGELIKIVDKAEDPTVVKMLAPYKNTVSEIKNAASGAVAEVALTNPRISDASPISVRNSETALGNLITDGMLAKAKTFNKDTMFAMQNGGGIRTSIKQGPITLGQIIEVLPFGNTLATMTLSGAEIKQALEHSVSQAPKESGGFLHVSGLKYTYDSSKPVGVRVQTIEVKTGDTFTNLDVGKNYLIATNAFTAKGGDGYEVFKKAYGEGRITDLGLSDWENLRDHVAQLKNVKPAIEGRIVDIKK